MAALKSHLRDFHAKNYTNAPPQDLAQTDLRPRYRRLRQREHALLAAMEDLSPILEKASMIQEQRALQEEVDSAQAQVVNIKFTFHNDVSTFTEDARAHQDEESVTSNAIQQQPHTSPIEWGNSLIQ